MLLPVEIVLLSLWTLASGLLEPCEYELVKKTATPSTAGIAHATFCAEVNPMPHHFARLPAEKEYCLAHQTCADRYFWWWEVTDPLTDKFVIHLQIRDVLKKGGGEFSITIYNQKYEESTTFTLNVLEKGESEALVPLTHIMTPTLKECADADFASDFLKHVDEPASRKCPAGWLPVGGAVCVMGDVGHPVGHGIAKDACDRFGATFIQLTGESHNHGQKRRRRATLDPESKTKEYFNEKQNEEEDGRNDNFNKEDGQKEYGEIDPDEEEDFDYDTTAFNDLKTIDLPESEIKDIDENMENVRGDKFISENNEDDKGRKNDEFTVEEDDRSESNNANGIKKISEILNIRTTSSAHSKEIDELKEDSEDVQNVEEFNGADKLLDADKDTKKEEKATEDKHLGVAKGKNDKDTQTDGEKDNDKNEKAAEDEDIGIEEKDNERKEDVEMVYDDEATTKKNGMVDVDIDEKVDSINHVVEIGDGVEKSDERIGHKEEEEKEEEDTDKSNKGEDDDDGSDADGIVRIDKVVSPNDRAEEEEHNKLNPCFNARMKLLAGNKDVWVDAIENDLRCMTFNFNTGILREARTCNHEYHNFGCQFDVNKYKKPTITNFGFRFKRRDGDHHNISVAVTKNDYNYHTLDDGVTSITIECQASGWPDPEVVVVQKDNPSWEPVLHESPLTINVSKIRGDLLGRFTCAAGNSFGDQAVISGLTILRPGPSTMILQPKYAIPILLLVIVSLTVCLTVLIMMRGGSKKRCAWLPFSRRRPAGSRQVPNEIFPRSLNLVYSEADEWAGDEIPLYVRQRGQRMRTNSSTPKSVYNELKDMERTEKDEE